MPKILGELQDVCAENLSADPSTSVAGRFWRNSTEDRIKTDDGVSKRALLRNDLKAVLGNSGPESENVRLHRGAAGVLQFVEGDDATAEGSLSANLNQISAKMETYTDAGKPAAGNAGRVVYISDLQTFLGDNGAAYVPLGGGGAGGALQWVEDGLSPIPEIENNQQVYKFEAGAATELYTVIRVPNSYVVGRPVNMRLAFYSPDSGGDVQLDAEATLIRPGSDTIDSTTNQRTTTTAAVTLTVVDRVEPIVLDLSDSVGEINSVQVEAGDLIKVRLYRDTDTATSEISALVYGAEVTFS